jgi:glutathione S-transferase
MALSLHHYNFWPASQAARVALLELNQAHEVVTVDMAAGAHKTAAFLALNPTAEPPVIVDTEGPDPSHNLVAWGALGVGAYLDARKTRLGLPGAPIIPQPPCNYPKTFQWAEWVAANLTIPMNTVLLHAKIKPAGDRDRAPFGAAIQALKAALATFERTNAAPNPGQFLNRDIEHSTPDNGIFSFADILFGSTMTYARLFPQTERVLGDAPRATAFLGSLEARPSFQQAFKGVTLSDGGTPPPPIEPPPP